ncbi:DegT/DnrJ/EryC1/StrS family aminotransferase [Lacinutrix undariae]
MNTKIWLSSPHMGENEQRYINEAFKTNWIAPLGPNVTGFENDLQTYLKGDTRVAALSSGTAALHLALILLDVKPGDEVICQSKTFAASANPICYLGATPVFIDSETETWNLCPEQLERAIKDRISKGRKPKAIIAVHLYGMPYKVTEINTIAKRYEIPIIEDSAEALGSTYNNEKCGTFGDLAILSFNGNKIITTSGGGALISKSEKLKQKTIFLATQARDNTVEYSHSEIGYNYRLSNVLAGIGRGQMEVLDAHVNLRIANFNFYKNALKNIEGLSVLNTPKNSTSNRWLTCILTPSQQIREAIRLALKNDNIESRPLWKPMHLQPVFKNYPAYTNGVSETLFKNGLCLPSGSNLTNTDKNRVVTVIKNALNV